MAKDKKDKGAKEPRKKDNFGRFLTKAGTLRPDAKKGGRPRKEPPGDLRLIESDLDFQKLQAIADNPDAPAAVQASALAKVLEFRYGRAKQQRDSEEGTLFNVQVFPSEAQRSPKLLKTLGLHAGGTVQGVVSTVSDDATWDYAE